MGGQLPAEVGEFADFLRALTRRLDRGAGWYGVFARRDPKGLEACLDGHEVPPWDVVQALLQDLSVHDSPQAARDAAARAADLYRASVRVYDTEVGGAAALRERLEAMRSEQHRAAGRERHLQETLHTAADPAARDALNADLAWARDDRERATARCEELSARLTALDDVPGDGHDPARTGAGGYPSGERGSDGRAPDGYGSDRLQSGGHGPGGPERGLLPDDLVPDGRAADGYGPDHLQPGGRSPERPERETLRPDGGGDPGAAPESGLEHPTPAARSRPRGARFAGVEADDGDGGGGAAPHPDPAPAPAVDTAEAPATPRGARFAGAYGDGGGPRRRRRGGRDESATHRAVREAARRGEAHRAAAEAVTRLGSLRAQGRGGEAHMVLCETAAWPAPRLPVLAAELERAGLGADVATLLWEMACLPPARLAAAAEALMRAGREADGERLLRQSVARPVAETAHTALALVAAGAGHEADLLLRALLRARSPEEAAGAAGEDPATLVPLLLDAADRVSASSRNDLALALRTAGLA
ncbi:hypothetical protein [Streptomyces cucumeris]|uniref:hypothetical protein n=1 Tax=Streptomyces cucumeris TaxID=2962890 RepID=UPI0020C85EC5|nr:hypothetical protein [Streptomyces sp. NEAU-Y11]MCP9205878.1 hypothetical protein [Streptomyces sp. NEAU-Y11]